MEKREIYNHNIKTLKGRGLLLHASKKTGLSCRIVRSDIGIPTLQVTMGEKKVFLHSKRDPLKEARRFAESVTATKQNVVVVVGFGLGYHIEELLNIDENVFIIVIEPSPLLLREALKTRDVSHIFLSKRVSFVVDTLTPDYESISPSISCARLVFYAPYRTLFPRQLETISEGFKSSINRREINTATLKRFDRLWTKNTFKNAAYFFSLEGIQALRYAFRNSPGIVVCAGPSLEEDIPTLKKLMNKCILIAVDTVFWPLIKRGIVPDFVVSVDPQFINSLSLAPPGERWEKKGEASTLIADPAIYPTLLKNFHGKKLISSSVFSPGKLIERFSGEKGSIAAGGSVAIAAFDFARVLGTDPIILTGLDLSYKSGRTHLKGSFIEIYALSKADRFQTVDTISTRSIRRGSPIFMRDKSGDMVTSDKRLLLYKSWFENHMKGSGMRVINATRGGLNIEGIENRGLEDLEKEASWPEKNKKEQMERVKKGLRNAPYDCKANRAFQRYLHTLQNNLLQVQKLSRRAHELTDLYFRQKIDDPMTDPIREELDLVDSEILTYTQETHLLSMVMQSPISNILDRPRRENRETVILNSAELYSSMEEGTVFLLKLIEISQKRVKKTSPNAENRNG